jgi:hypothetical protein
MAGVDIDWVKDQMTRARIKKGSGDTVLKLIEVWNAEYSKHSEAIAREAIEVFSKLALGHAIAEEKAPMDGTWIDCQPGQIKVADIVRVKSDAFDGVAGERHNGRVCKVVAVRYGDIIYKSIDERDPRLDGTHYSPHALEKLIPV